MDVHVVMLTDGRGACLDRALDSLARNLSGDYGVTVFDDSGSVDYRWTVAAACRAFYDRTDRVACVGRRGEEDGDLPRRIGFCRAVRAAWQSAAAFTAVPWVLWWEDDFALDEPVDLADLIHAMTVNPGLAQLALMRQPVTHEERTAGGVLERHGDEVTVVNTYADDRLVGTYREHPYYWTTNPSLISREFIAAHPWPDGPECEGKFGLALKAEGWRFGAWGPPGTRQVTHDGPRIGTGY